MVKEAWKIYFTGIWQRFVLIATLQPTTNFDYYGVSKALWNNWNRECDLNLDHGLLRVKRQYMAIF